MTTGYDFRRDRDRASQRRIEIDSHTETRRERKRERRRQYREMVTLLYEHDMPVPVPINLRRNAGASRQLRTHRNATVMLASGWPFGLRLTTRPMPMPRRGLCDERRCNGWELYKPTQTQDDCQSMARRLFKCDASHALVAICAHGNQCRPGEQAVHIEAGHLEWRVIHFLPQPELLLVLLLV